MKKWLLVDGYNMAFRAFYAIQELRRSDGFPTNAIHGWVKSLWRLEDIAKPDHIVVFFDLGGAQRQLEIMPEYKANRKETPEDLVKQVPYIKNITKHMGYPLIEKQGVEADDLIATVACQLSQDPNNDIYIVSADKDLAQCLSENVSQLLPPPSAKPSLGWRTLTPEGVLDKFGVTVDQIPDYLALIGDASDNIAGIQGVGPKTAQKWLEQHGSIEGIIKKCEGIKPVRFASLLRESGPLLERNLELITLKDDFAITEDIAQEDKADIDALASILEECEMGKALAEVTKRYSSNVS